MRRLLAILALLLVCGLASCTIPTCQHEHAFRIFVVDPPEPMWGNEVCPDCTAVLSSWTYQRPWLGPPEWLPTDQILLRGRALPHTEPEPETKPDGDGGF